MKVNLITQQLVRAFAYMCLGRVTAVIGATTSAFTTSGTPTAIVAGKFVVLTAQTNTALSALAAADLPSSLARWLQPSGLTGFYTQPANTTVYYVIGVNGAGTWKVVQGTFAGQELPVVGGLHIRGDGLIPDVPEGFTPVTIMKVVSGGSAFVPGTTALTGIATFQDCPFLPLDDTF